jgi:protease stability complex PrcB-like protein
VRRITRGEALASARRARTRSTLRIHRRVVTVGDYSLPEGPMTGRSLSLLVLLSTAACGTGRLVPVDTAEPAAAPPSPEPVAAPAPAGQPVAQAPAPTSDTTAAVVPVAPAPAAGYAPYDLNNSIAIRRIGQWSTSGITGPARVVIRDDSDYAKFWSGLGNAGSRPSVDFTRDIVIAVAAGQQSTGGHSIAVERVTRVGAGLAVEVTETVPAPGCATTQALTQPVDVVVVAAADVRTWSFSDRRVAGC